MTFIDNYKWGET